MTMSGSSSTVTTGPLDLTNKTHDLNRTRPNPDQPDSEHRCTNGAGVHPRDARNGSEDAKVVGIKPLEGPRTPRLSSPPTKSVNQTDPAGKMPESSFSKLPIRKRPFPAEPACGREPRNKLKEKSCGPKAHETQSHTDRGAQRTRSCEDERAQPFKNISATYFIAGYYPWLQQPIGVPVLSCPPPPESSDWPLADISAATRQDEDGDTPLHIAVVKENDEYVRWLIEIFQRAHRDLDIFNNLRQTPLHLAVITHQPSMVKVLLDAGADPGALDRHGQTALHLCCEHGETNCLDVILRHYPHKPSPHLEIRNYEGMTPLHLAVQSRDITLARILLNRGAEINAGDNKSGRSPLMHAVENDCIDMVNLLIESGCDVNAQSYSGNTALHSACGRGRIEVVRLLLKNGADSCLKNNHNDTAIMVAQNQKNTEKDILKYVGKRATAVSDVLRGKGTRSNTVKAQSINNGPLSPGSSNHSPLLTPTHQRSSSLSPVTSVVHSPRSQSVDNISEQQSPVNGNDKTLLPRSLSNITADNGASYGLALHPFQCFSPSFLHIHRRTLIAGPYYGFPNPPYYTDAQIIGIPLPVSPSQGPANQSRPSSHSSDQSDISNMSINSEERS